MPNWGFVWMVAWPDFRTRLTRFMVIGLGMALVMAVTLLLAAFSEGFRLRSERLLDVFEADRYIVATGSSGPMTATTPLPASLADEIGRNDDVVARSLFLIPTAILTDGSPQGVIVVGSTGEEPGFRLVDGRRVERAGEAVVDEEILGLATGDEFVLAGQEFSVVGQTEHATWDIANAGVFIQRQQALDLFAGGNDVVTAVAIDGDGEIGRLPAGVEVQSRSDGFDDVLNRTAAAKRSIDSFTVTLWALAVVIVGAVLSVEPRPRARPRSAGRLGRRHRRRALDRTRTPHEARVPRSALVAAERRVAGDPGRRGDRGAVEHRGCPTGDTCRPQPGVRVR